MVWVMFFSCLHLMREVVLKERVISSSGFVYRAFGEEEGEGNSVGSNSLGGALADYNMQVHSILSFTKNVSHIAHSDFSCRTSSACLGSTAKR